jgi:hypothetical protein
MTLLGPAWSNSGGNADKPRLFYWPLAACRCDVEMYWEPRDMWVGLFVDTRPGKAGTPLEHDRYRHVYLCLLPCLPLHIWWFIGPAD